MRQMKVEKLSLESIQATELKNVQNEECDERERERVKTDRQTEI